MAPRATLLAGVALLRFRRREAPIGSHTGAVVPTRQRPARGACRHRRRRTGARQQGARHAGRAPPAVVGVIGARVLPYTAAVADYRSGRSGAQRALRELCLEVLVLQAEP